MDETSHPRILLSVVRGSCTKYLGLTLVLAWHYCLWFVPNAFPSVNLLDDRVTFAWLTALACTVVTVVLLAIVLGRTRHIPRSSLLIWCVAGFGCLATLTLTYGANPNTSILVCYGASAVIGVCAGLMWVMWGERHACQRSRFTLRRIAPTYGITLLVGLSLVYVMPWHLAPILVSLIPLLSGFLLNYSWRHAPVSSFPPLLPRKTTRQGRHAIVTVCLISFVAAFVGYFTVAIVPWNELGAADERFTLGIAIGAALLLFIAVLQLLMPHQSTVFRLFPWLIFFCIIACLLCALGSLSNLSAFLLALAVSSVFEVLVIMYMAQLTLSGYTPSATAFGMSAAAIRLGIALGNGMALIYERTPGLLSSWTTPTLLVFVAILAGLLIPLVREEYGINDLTHSPVDATEWTRTVQSIAEQFHLSPREKEILNMLGRGYTAAAIAEKLVISPHTVNTHIQHVYEKMGIHKRSEMLDYLNKR
ncbi:MAG: helix-turn-helix transcriptional regulator [Propionibacteriaceae bacterium]|nr:helix-turn-helix transcriptional regulator [Propionibacteriaceae bacterium]